jgi:hypothetical protein
MAPNTPVHPWITSLRLKLDALEAALLTGDAPAVEAASSDVQAVLQKAPKTAEFARPGSALRTDMLQAAHHFGQLRQSVLRTSAQNQRVLKNLMPERARSSTYGRGIGTSNGSGAGRAFLSA